VIPPPEVAGSLALQMNQRAMDEERVWLFLFFPEVSSLSIIGRRRVDNENKKKLNEQKQ